MGVRFPPSARFRYLNHIGSFHNSAVLLKFTLSRAELSTLMAASPLAGESLRTDVNFCAINDPPADWDAGAASSFQSARAGRRDGGLMVTIVHAEAENPTIYLYLYYDAV